MLSSLLLFAVGLSALLLGGYLLVEGASSMARAAGVPPLVIGLTLVAFGTSMPELAVNVSAALAGSSEIAFGNVIGSNIANIGLIAGVAATIRTLQIQSQLILREIPLMLLATGAAAVMAFDVPLGVGPAVYDRADGLLLLLFFGVFLYAIVGDVVRRRHRDPLVATTIETAPTDARWSAAKSAAIGTLGLGALVAGGEVAVRGAVDMSIALGVPPAIIGLSVVAVGTSLPELVTSVIAAVRGEADIAVGNIVGSNIFNLLFIMGATAVIRPTPVPSSGYQDVVGLIAFSILLLLFGLTHGRRIVRSEGLGLLMLWAAFVAWRVGLFT